MWACAAEGVLPDVMLIGKGLSGGVVPVAAAVATPDAYALINRDPLMHSSTFACAPIAMAAAEAAVRAIIEEKVPERAAALELRLLPAMTAILDEHCPHLVRQVRGVGLLYAFEFHAAEVTGDFLLELLDQGVVASHSLNASAILRMTPPACLSEDDIAYLLSAVDRAAAALAKLYPAKTVRRSA
jgi:putrescine aminotransferase